MIKGKNRADPLEKKYTPLEEKDQLQHSGKPCLFISHQYEDRAISKKIARYLRNLGFDYYLDTEDELLQQAVIQNNPIQITQRIKEGIANSTHLLCIVSKNTFTSNWVPFEIGYAHAAIIGADDSKNSRICILTTQEISTLILPEYMTVVQIIRGRNSFNNYLLQLSNTLKKGHINRSLLESQDFNNYLLQDILNPIL